MTFQVLMWGTLLGLIAVVRGWQPDFVLRVSETTLLSDCTPRLSVVVNGTSPGPLLTLHEGEHYWIRVYNDLATENTTLHWHGFSQFTTPFSDGTPLASQWPIPPGHFFDYEFQLQPGFHGTYWYHSHVGMQLGTAQGPIIVLPKDRSLFPVEYDEDIVMMLGDYYHATDATISAGVLNTTKFGWIGEPQSLLVNGHAANRCNASTLVANTSCSTTCGNNLQMIQPGKRYRVRVISGIVLSYIQLALEGHQMTLFEVDGTYIEPMPIQDLQIAGGQRYSVLIEAKNSSVQTETNGAAVWRYSNRTDTPSVVSGSQWNMNVSTSPTPATLNQTVLLPNETFGWVSGDIVQYKQKEYPPSDAEVTRMIILDGQQLVENKGFRWAVNNVINNETSPGTPYLVQYYQTPQSLRAPDYTGAIANGGYDSKTGTYPAKLGEVLDIVIQNLAGPSGVAEAHPWHSHGNKYWDMGAGIGNFSYHALNASLVSRRGRPFLRDTSVAYAGPGPSYNGSSIPTSSPAGWRLFRIKVQDPMFSGLWLLHCHISPHQIMGMQVALMYGAENLPALPATLQQEFLTFGGGVSGQPTYDYTGSDTTATIPRSYFEETKREQESRRSGE